MSLLCCASRPTPSGRSGNKPRAVHGGKTGVLKRECHSTTSIVLQVTKRRERRGRSKEGYVACLTDYPSWQQVSWDEGGPGDVWENYWINTGRQAFITEKTRGAGREGGEGRAM